MDAGLQTLIFMGLILKVPVLAACWIIWHAVRAEPDVAEAPEEGDGHERRRFRRDPRPKRPRGPRRGPHAPGTLPLPCPEDDGALRVLRRPAYGTLPSTAHGDPERPR